MGRCECAPCQAQRAQAREVVTVEVVEDGEVTARFYARRNEPAAEVWARAARYQWAPHVLELTRRARPWLNRAGSPRALQVAQAIAAVVEKVEGR